MFSRFMWDTFNTDVGIIFACMYLESEIFMVKSDVFNTELNYINDEKIRESARYLLDRLPDYFYLTVMPVTRG